MSRAILFHNADYSTLLLDLPASLEEAQAIPERQILSTTPLQIPFVTPEPKGAKRDRLLAQLSASKRCYHDDLLTEVVAASNTIQPCSFSGASWCLPRWCCDTVTLDTIPQYDLPTSPAVNPPLVLSSIENCFTSSLPLRNALVSNATQVLTVVRDLETSLSFLVPAGSVFLWASIADGLDPFAKYVQASARRRTFDLILLDPPWANRSVRKSKVYNTAEDQQTDPCEQTAPIIDQYLAQDGFIAIWITNKTAIRETVTSRFLLLGLILVEEWIWVKVTGSGVPVTPLDGVWRKPYEILLLYRRTDLQREVKRRLIFAVPDFHSRKPSLKHLFEEFLPPDYLALELFARSLTKGWLAWGNEVLKFQDKRFWRSVETP